MAARLGTGVLVATGGVPAMQAGHGSSGSSRRRPESVTVSARQAVHDRSLEIETSSEPFFPERAGEEMLLHRWVTEWSNLARERVSVEFPIRFEATAERWRQDVEVDGVASTFTFVGNSEVWVAAGAAGGRPVELQAQGWPAAGLALESVSPGAVRADG